MGRKDHKYKAVKEKDYAFGCPWLVYSGEDPRLEASLRKKRYGLAACLLLIAGAALFLLLSVLSKGGISVEKLERLQQERDVPLKLSLSYKDVALEKDISITVLPEHIGKDKAESLFDECEQWIKARLAEGLEFPEQAPNGVLISWETDDLSYIGAQGPTLFTLIAQLGAGEYSRLCEFSVRVDPGAEDYLSSLDKLAADTAEDLSGKDNGPALALPTLLDGVKLNWSLPSDPLPGLVLLASGFAAVFVWFKRDDSAKKKMERRRKAFELQIPDMSLQMILLLNAGLVVESAFAELLSRESADDGPLYTIFRDLKALSRAKNTSFVTELYCYARKAASADLMRFATLVYEHAGRGSSLADKLEREREMQSSAKMSAARAKVRQAETRLCFPLILLLIALIIITALPSFMSM